MKQQHYGSGQPSSWVQETADFLVTRYPETICLVTGLQIWLARGEPKQLDLLAVTGGAIFIGLEWRRDRLDPQEVVQLVVSHVQSQRLAAQSIPVYVFWLDQTDTAPASAELPVLRRATAVEQFIHLVSQDLPIMPDGAVTKLFKGFLALETPNAGKSTGGDHPTPPLHRALRRVGDLPGKLDRSLQDFIGQPLSPRGRHIQPADVNRYLERALLDRNNHLEDTSYRKIVPNDYLVELDPDNYERHYRPIHQQLCQGWQTFLLEALDTANNRAGRKEYRFGGAVRVQVKPAAAIQAGRVQISCGINPDAMEAAVNVPVTACLEMPGSGRRFPLRSGITTIGRNASCDIYLDDPAVRAKRLISGQHAYILAERSEYQLFDGSPTGKASTNGTFANGIRIVNIDRTPKGYPLNEGDQIILAALDLTYPRPDTPGVAVFIFRHFCGEGRHDR